MKNLATKILKVIKEVEGTVGKSGWNSFQKYKYITEADITDAMRPALLNHNLVVFTSVKKSEEMSPAGKNSDQKIYQVTFQHTIVDADSGESTVLDSVGTGADSLDKAVFKAQAGAFKYFFMKNFFISGEGDDPENDGSGKKPVDSPSSSAPKTSGFKPKIKTGTKPNFSQSFEKPKEDKPKTGTKINFEASKKPKVEKEIEEKMPNLEDIPF